MKKVLKSMALVIVMVMVVSLIPTKLQATAASKPTLSKKKVTVNVGKSKVVSIKANGKKITEVKWKTSDKSIAKITEKDDQQAKIEGVSKGKATITATVKTKSKTYKLKVKVTVKNGKSDAQTAIDELKGDESCTTCNGAGSVTCSYCHGKGVTIASVVSFGPGGVQTEEEESTCPVCNGVGKTPCPDCIGFETDLGIKILK